MLRQSTGKLVEPSLLGSLSIANGLLGCSLLNCYTVAVWNRLLCSWLNPKSSRHTSVELVQETVSLNLCSTKWDNILCICVDMFGWPEQVWQVHRWLWWLNILGPCEFLNRFSTLASVHRLGLYFDLYHKAFAKFVPEWLAEPKHFKIPPVTVNPIFVRELRPPPSNASSSQRRVSINNEVRLRGIEPEY